MAKLEEKNTKNKLEKVDLETYEWTKEQSHKSFQASLVYGTIVVSMVAIYLTYGYLLVQKIKS